MYFKEDLIRRVIKWVRKQPMPEFEIDPVYIIPKFWQPVCYLDGNQDFHWRTAGDILDGCTFEHFRRIVSELIYQSIQRRDFEEKEILEIAGYIDMVGDET